MKHPLFLLVVTLFFIAACSTPRQDTASERLDSEAIKVLEFDNTGRLQNRDDLERYRAEIAAAPQTVVVFMHGWHGSASPTDHSVQSFKKALAEVRARSYKGSGRKLTGVYLTWHASYLPGLAEYPMYFFTKARAGAVGEGNGIADAIKELSKAARRHGGEHFIVAGHSFGGRILGHVAGKHPEVLENVDLWLLANAADDASDCKKTIEAVSTHPYTRGRLPKLVWVTSAHDPMTGFAYEVAGFQKASGWDKKLQSHRISIVEPTAEHPRYSADVEKVSDGTGRYAHNLIVENVLKGHSDVWGEPMIQIVNYYVLHQ